ncbi:hypothetical protein C0585_04430 [Candidatus Woesearchaeota archaeon]|nr:MAG: hypothetical protein C0585_04430 [Candidatus Woesearchaeota archaeon]
MTTLIGMKVKEPYNAVVLGSDIQASYKEPLETPGATLHIEKKMYVPKIFATPDEDMAIAMAGAATEEYQAFKNNILGASQDLKFDFREDLTKGFSSTIRDLNFSSSTRNGYGDYNLNDTFFLLVAYAKDDDVELYRVSNSGKIFNIPAKAMGSGENYASDWINVIMNKSLYPKEAKSELAKATYLVMAGLDEAINIDKHSSGKDVVIVSNKGIENITQEMYKELSELEWKKRMKIINGLNQSF